LALTFMAHAILSVTGEFDLSEKFTPKVAIHCGKVPFYTDLKTGTWVADSEGATVCDKENKEVVVSYCKKVYPTLNVINIVEVNEPVLFNNWCEPGQTECTTLGQVVPYKCLLQEYEADALMVPNGCHFDHLHDENLCLSHDQWKLKAQAKCSQGSNKKLNDYGILLSCGTDVFTGVEFVCCPTKEQEKEAKEAEELFVDMPDYDDMDDERTFPAVDVAALSSGIKGFQRHMPLVTEGCDYHDFAPKKAALEDKHRSRIAAVVEEWDEAERRYSKLKQRDPNAAQEKMRRTLEVFKETVAALEAEAKEEKDRLRNEKNRCINSNIDNDKRIAMMAYIEAIQEKVPSPEKILSTVRKFIQVCEHDRVHSLRHFEHVRNRDPQKADNMRNELLEHLKGLNTLVNESMSLLTYLPEIAAKFGLSDASDVILKPRIVMPEAPKEEEHHHEEIPKELRPTQIKKTKKEKKVKKIKKTKNTPKKEKKVEEERKSTLLPTEDVPKVEKVEKTPEVEQIPEEEPVKDKVIPVEEEEDMTRDIRFKDEDETEYAEDKKEEEIDLPKQVEDVFTKKPSTGFAMVIGLSCGALVIMLGILVALVVRMRRNMYTRVMIPTEDIDDQQHLVEMQKNGFENPTYKFYYF